MEIANRYLQTHHLPAFNAEFTQVARGEGRATGDESRDSNKEKSQESTRYAKNLASFVAAVQIRCVIN